MNLSKEEIIKSLECCRYGGRCSQCVGFEMPICQAFVNENAILLINELIEENQEVRSNWQKLKDAYDEVCVETIDEFADRLKDCAWYDEACDEYYIIKEYVDEVAIKMKKELANETP